MTQPVQPCHCASAAMAIAQGCSRHGQPIDHPHWWTLCQREDYRRLWDGLPQQSDLPQLAGLCKHLGEELERRQCATCQGHVEVKILECAVHGRCTVAKAQPELACCASCPDKRVAVPQVRNLLYHVYPRKGNGVWQRNVDYLLKHRDLFTGQRVLALAVDSGTDAINTVLDYCQGLFDKFVCVCNNPDLREVATWEQLWQHLELNEDSITFYAHAKGVTRALVPEVTIHTWTDLLYQSLLDYFPAVEEVLERFPIAGSFKKVGAGFKDSESSWHYSGSFFWVRTKEFFARNWRDIDQQWFGNEAIPGKMWKPEQAGCVFHQGVVPSLDLYNRDYLQGTVLPAWQMWQQSHQRRIP